MTDEARRGPDDAPDAPGAPDAHDAVDPASNAGPDAPRGAHRAENTTSGDAPPRHSTPHDSTPGADVPPTETAAAETTAAGTETTADEPAETTADDAPPDESRRRRRRREKQAKPRRKAPWWELPVLVLVAIGIAILVKSFIVQPFYIPSESMEKTLHGCDGCSGDRILVNKPIYSVLRDPEPGDIVVFDAPPGWDREGATEAPSNPVVKLVRGFGQLVGFVPPDGEVLVKRVIAVGGQTVKGDADGRVMVSDNGAAGPYRTLKEPYVYDSGGEQPNFTPITVPKGRLWVMGDHRDASADSRYHCTPGGAEGTEDDDNCDPTSSTVPIDKVIGKAFVIAWPPSRWDTLGTPTTFANAAAMAGPGLPVTASLATVLPVFAARRRRRNR